HHLPAPPNELYSMLRQVGTLIDERGRRRSALEMVLTDKLRRYDVGLIPREVKEAKRLWFSLVQQHGKDGALIYLHERVDDFTKALPTATAAHRVRLQNNMAAACHMAGAARVTPEQTVATTQPVPTMMSQVRRQESQRQPQRRTRATTKTSSRIPTIPRPMTLE